MGLHTLTFPEFDGATVAGQLFGAGANVVGQLLSPFSSPRGEMGIAPLKREQDYRVAFRPTGLTQQGESRPFLSVASEDAPNAFREDVLYGTRSGNVRLRGENLASARSVKSIYYMDFLVQSITRSQVEKTQLIDTFGEDVWNFYGKSPLVLGVSAVLLQGRYRYWGTDGQTQEYIVDWESEWWENFNAHLSASSLATKGMIATFGYEDKLFHGYIISASTTQQLPEQKVISLQYSFLVRSQSAISVPVPFMQLPEVLGADFLDGDSVRRVSVTQETDIEKYAAGALNKVGANMGYTLLNKYGLDTGVGGKIAKAGLGGIHGVGEVLQKNASSLKTKVESIYGAGYTNDVLLDAMDSTTVAAKFVDAIL